jgi:kynurenine formamidase/glycosyltransferase involved in cell wall biosynthesis
MRASIVIRSFNEEEHIGRLLRGIFEQSVQDFEVILVDSGSTDRTVEVAESFSTKVVTLDPTYFSFGRSLNLGCAEATGDILVFISAHCYPADELWLEGLLAPFSDSRVALAYGKQRGNEATKFSEHRVFEKWFPDRSEHDQRHPFCNNANCAIRRVLWEEQPYDEELTGLEDIAWARTMLESGWHIVYAPEAEVVHVHEESPGRIYNRYRREAIAFKSIFPHERFGRRDFARLVSAHIWSDLRAAYHEGVLLRRFYEIFMFRLMQYAGTYRGFAQHGPVESDLKQRLYYPDPPKKTRRVPDRRGNGRAARPSRIVDISVPLSDEIPSWPGSIGYTRSLGQSMEDGAPVNASEIEMDVHCGTHIDAPRHFLSTGATVDSIPLPVLIGPCAVVDLADCASISSADLISRIGEDGPWPGRVLFKTSNSGLWKASPVFCPNYVALTADAATLLAERGTRLVGIDYLSIQRFEDGPEVHEILLAAGIVILEGLDLSRVAAGPYELMCLPLRLGDGAEGAPARAVLRTLK